MGVDQAAYAAMPADERRERLAGAEAELKGAGADYVIEDVSALMPLVRSIAERLTTA
jgi:hypothetical protein